MYQQSFLSTITLDVSGSGYLVTGIYWKLQRRYHRDQITTTRNMSRLHQSDGLSILARYTSVAAIAIASSAPSETAINSGIAIPITAKTMWNASDIPICERAKNKSFKISPSVMIRSTLTPLRTEE
jgi:hypothetical protein